MPLFALANAGVALDGLSLDAVTLRAAGIGVQVHYVPVTHHPSFGIDAAGRRRFPNTEAAYAGLLSLPLFPTLTEADQDDVVARLAEVLHAGGDA